MSQNILVIDDDSGVRQLVGDALNELGFKVTLALNAKNGFAILQTSQAPALILVDLIMPGMDGVNFILMLRASEEFKNLPVILMTAEKNPEFLLEAETLNLAGLLLKPVDLKLLIDKVNRVLKNKKS